MIIGLQPRYINISYANKHQDNYIYKHQMRIPSSSDIYQTVQTKYHTAITHTVFEKYEISYSYSQRRGSGCVLITARKGQSPFLSHEEEDAIAEYLYEMDKRRMDIFSKAISLQIEIYRQVLNATHLI